MYANDTKYTEDSVTNVEVYINELMENVETGDKPKGTIAFEEPEWQEDGTATVKVTTDKEKYDLQYQIGGVEEEKWIIVGEEGIIEGLKHNDTVYARLWNGKQGSDYASTTVKDTIPPEVSVETINITSNSVTLTVTASDAQTGLAEGETYKYYLNNESSPKEASTNDSYNYTGLTAGTKYTLKVVVTDKAGLTTEKTAEITTLSIPTGTGAISFTSPTWSNGQASVKVNTSNTGYQIEYQKNSTSGTWTKIANGGTISGLKHNDNVYARLTDGQNTGDYASTTVKDTVAPIVSIKASNITSNSATLVVTASDEETGLAESGTYKYYLNSESTPKATSTNDSYNYTGLTAGTKYTLKVVVTDKVGLTTEKTAEITTLSIPAGTGAITFTSPTWSNGQASVKVNTSNTGYQIEYQKNSTSGTWTKIANGGIISELKHNDNIYARLTDGKNVGSHASTTVKDTTPPTVSISVSNITTNSAKLTVTASDAQTGLETSGTYKYYLNSENSPKATSTTNSYTYTGLKVKTGYTLKVVVTDKAGLTTTKTTTITTADYPTIEKTLKEGNYVNFVDKTGVTRKCVVLYGPENTNYSSYGIQIITMDTVEDVIIGATGNLSASRTSYNNAISTLNNATSKYLNTTYATKVRCVGSVPNNPTYDGAGYFTINPEDNLEGYFTPYNGTFKNADNNYLSDWNQMNTLNIYNINTDYWLASRNIKSDASVTDILVRYVNSRGKFGNNSQAFIARIQSDTVIDQLPNGIRPVFTLKAGLKVTGGAGTSASPYTLGV